MKTIVRITIPYDRVFGLDTETIFEILFGPERDSVCRHTGATGNEVAGAIIDGRAHATGSTSSFDLNFPTLTKAIEFKLTHECEDLRIEVSQ